MGDAIRMNFKEFREITKNMPDNAELFFRRGAALVCINSVAEHPHYKNQCLRPNSLECSVWCSCEEPPIEDGSWVEMSSKTIRRK
jgi:hypothetical protein